MRIIPTLALVALLVPQAVAQNWSVEPDHVLCKRSGDWARHCEVREATIPAESGVLRIDGGVNGGVKVAGWDGSEIVVRATVKIHDRHRGNDAEKRAREIEIRTDGGEIRAVGPDKGHDWSVSYRIQVPRFTDLSIETHNGGIGIEHVEGVIEFRALNGGVSLDALAGDVRGMTQNGGLRVTLDGVEWNGAGLDVRTQNGGVKLAIPEDYSTELETGTVNGKVRVDFPIRVQGSLNKRIRTTLGHGGAPVSVTTTNGGVVLSRL